MWRSANIIIKAQEFYILTAVISSLNLYFTALQLDTILDLTYQAEIWHKAQLYHSNQDFRIYFCAAAKQLLSSIKLFQEVVHS